MTSNDLQWFAAVILVIVAAVCIGCLWCALMDICFNKARGIRKWCRDFWFGELSAMPERVKQSNSPAKS